MQKWHLDLQAITAGQGISYWNWLHFIVKTFAELDCSDCNSFGENI